MKSKQLWLVSAALCGSMLLAGCNQASNDKADVQFKVESNLYGLAYTDAKSTLKKEYGEEITYVKDSKATFTLTLPDNVEIDDNKIDDSQATIKLLDGDGYYANEFKLSKKSLNGKWTNGVYEFTLEPGDLDYTNGDYEVDNGGREWSCLGGNGNGHYYFNLLIDGLKYDGKEVDSQEFRAEVQVYGYDYTSDAAELYPTEVVVEEAIAPLEQKTSNLPKVTDTPIWTWIGAGEQPILCDDKADDFYISWPDNYNASNLSAADIKITLFNDHGDQLKLEANEDYVINSEADETQIAIKYMYWAFAPVYTEMNIEIDNGAVMGTSKAISQDYEIASVYVNPIQSGGGLDRDKTVVAMSFYGFDNLTSLKQLAFTFNYILKMDDNGTTKYYSEDSAGNAILTEDKGQAKTFDASSKDDYNAKLIGNSVFFTSHLNVKENKKISGQKVSFDKEYSYSSGSYAKDLKAAKGYIIPENMMAHHKWAWQVSLNQGWRTLNVTPYEGRYSYNVNKGTSQQFNVEAESSVTWKIKGNTSKDTVVSDDGIVTVASDEEATAIALSAFDETGNCGGISIKVK